MVKVAAVTNLDTYNIEIHRIDCKDLGKTNHEIDVIETAQANSWAQTVFGEVEEDVWENPSAFVKYYNCSK